MDTFLLLNGDICSSDLNLTGHIMLRFRQVFDPSLIIIDASFVHAGMIVVVYLALISCSSVKSMLGSFSIAHIHVYEAM
jgi:hypothetical protein